VCALLERFGGYTLQTLLDEDAELLRLVQIEALGRPEDPEIPDTPTMPHAPHVPPRR
jgi:hypothetical protein